MSPWGEWILSRISITELGAFHGFHFVLEACQRWAPRDVLGWWRRIALMSGGTR